jgi:putative membrane protein
MSIFHWAVATLAVFAAAFLVPGVTVTFWGAVLAALVLGIINAFIKPVVKLLTLPITIVTLGLFSLVLNALFVMLAARIVPGFSVSGFWTAFFFAIALSLINMFLGVGKKAAAPIA